MKIIDNEDDELIRNYQQGSEQAYTVLFKKYYPLVYRLFINKGISHFDAEDFTIEVFTRLIKGLKAFRFEKPFQHYLYRIVRNRLFDFYRQKRFDLYSLGFKQLPDALSSNQYEQTELAELIEHCMQQITSTTRRAILSTWMEGYKRRQIADILDLPLGTVHSNLERGKSDLRECLKENF